MRRTRRRRTLFGTDLDFTIYDSRRSFFGIAFGAPCPPASGFESGVLGGGWLWQFVVELDFPGRRVRFIDPERFGVPESVSARAETVVPLQAVHGRPTIVPMRFAAPARSSSFGTWTGAKRHYGWLLE